MINCGPILFSITEEEEGRGGGGLLVSDTHCGRETSNIKISILISSDLYFLWKILISVVIMTLKYFYFISLFILSIFCINFLNFQFAE